MVAVLRGDVVLVFTPRGLKRLRAPSSKIESGLAKARVTLVQIYMELNEIRYHSR